MKPWEKYAQTQDGPWSRYQKSNVAPSDAPQENNDPTHGINKSWSDVGLQALGNIPSSASNLAGNVYQAVRHPIDTAGNVMDIAGGGIRNMLPESVAHAIDSVDQNPAAGQAMSDKASAVGKFYKDRYGSMDGVKQAIANDPVGVSADAATVLTGGGALAAKIPGLAGKAGKMAEVVGNAIDPIALAGKILKPIANKTGSIASSVLGNLGTHTGTESIKEAARSGYQGGQRSKDFTDAMRGNSEADSVVTDAKIALSNMRKDRGDQYRSGMSGVSSDTSVLDFKPIDQALTDISNVGSYKGKSISRSTSGTMQKVSDVVDEWRNANPSDFHTPEGMDALKRAIGDIRDSTDFGTPSRLVADKVYHAVKSQITKQAPEYAKTMADYEQASGLLKEIEKSLSLGNKASADTALRKLQSTIRNNVNTNYGKRLDLVDTLEKSGGVSLRPRIAGDAMNSWTPRGLGNVMAGGTGAAAVMTANPALVPLLAAQSPRLVGELVHLAGKGAGKVGRANQKLAQLLSEHGTSGAGLSRQAFQAGRTNEIK